MTDKELVDIAFDAMERTYSPYSGFAVGAAVECFDGTVFTGCNVENASYSASICAERVAVCKAISEGYTDFLRIAIAANSENHCVPCGTCRQVLYEFSREIKLLCANKNGEYVRYKIKELLPYGFELEK